MTSIFGSEPVLAAGPCEVPSGHPLAAVVAYLANPGAAVDPETRSWGDNLAAAYAPRIWWHRKERHTAMEPAEFIQSASLWSTWRGVTRRIIPAGKVVASDLPKYSANHFLKFEGNPIPGNSQPPMFWKLGGGKAARALCTYTATSATILIEYWYHIAYNRVTDIGIGNHEGDWEGGAMLVELNTEKNVPYRRIRAGYLSAHEGGGWYCPDEFRWTTPNPLSGRPVVYSALGSHATYPSVGDHDGPVLTDRTNLGKAWDSWRNMRPMVLEPYFGFKGRWGDLSVLSFMCGPKIPCGKTKFQPGNDVEVPDLRRCRPR